MREIKFRAWEKIGQKMISFENLLKDKGYIEETLANFSTTILLQYTGLKDKNGKDIYEGDIVIDKVFGNSEVKFLNASFCIKPPLSTHWVIGEKRAGDMEIIGDIYQNPELLK